MGIKIEIQNFYYESHKKNNDFFISVLLHFYYLNSTKSWLSHQKSGIVPEVTLIKKWTLSPNFNPLSLKMTKLEVGEETYPPAP